MARMKRSDILSAAQLGYCLVCWEERGFCSCPEPTQKQPPEFRRFSSHTEGDSGRFFFCPDCKSIQQFAAGLTVYRCDCGYIFEHLFEPSVLSPRDYTEELNVVDLPKRALRKPRI